MTARLQACRILFFSESRPPNPTPFTRIYAVLKFFVPDWIASTEMGCAVPLRRHCDFFRSLSSG